MQPVQIENLCISCNPTQITNYDLNKYGDDMDRYYPQRKPNRLKGYDYSLCGRYYITICIQNREPCFGFVDKGAVALNDVGVMVDNCITHIGEIHQGIKIPCKIVMPDHVHFIIELQDNAYVGVAYDATRPDGTPTCREKSKMEIPKIVQQFKTVTQKLSRQMNMIRDVQTDWNQDNFRQEMHGPEDGLHDLMDGLHNSMDGLHVPMDGLHDMQPLHWQRGYYDRIIRDEEEYQRICQYIQMNPRNWRWQEHTASL